MCKEVSLSKAKTAEQTTNPYSNQPRSVNSSQH
jgi:hypothetical protein